MAITAAEAVQSRDIQLYTQAYASTNAMPTDSAAQTAPGGAWSDKGATSGGVDVRISAEYADAHVDQQIYPIFTVGTSGDIHLVTNLAQLTPQNLQQVTGQGALATVAAGSGTYGHVDLTISGAIAVNFFSALLQVKNATGDGQDIRIALWKSIAKGSPQPKFIGTALSVLPLDLQGYPDSANSDRVATWRDIITPLP